jgi:hypothetical protein
VKGTVKESWIPPPCSVVSQVKRGLVGNVRSADCLELQTVEEAEAEGFAFGCRMDSSACH